ncbi:MAG: metallophosphoesterase [Proteobacteria bacterium]|nr:metallophosphoesterase [Pseudomonadota bacterium]
MIFTLAHLSDPHIGPLPHLPLRALLNKRLTGALNWHSARATIHNMDVLETILDDIIAQDPDHIALTGDLVNVGFAPEFATAHLKIARLGGPEEISIVPGNHDAYVRSSLPEMIKVFSPYMRNDGEGPKAPLRFPYLRRRGPLALIGVNSGIPTLPFFATGALGEPQREALAQMLDQTRAEGLFRVVMIHHPPLRSGARFGRGLNDAEAVTQILARHGAELVLHGHNHRHSLARIEGKSCFIPVLGVASASAVPGTPHHQAEYHLIRIESSTGMIEVERRGFKEFSHAPVAIDKVKIRHELLTP